MRVPSLLPLNQINITPFDPGPLGIEVRSSL